MNRPRILIIVEYFFFFTYIVSLIVSFHWDITTRSASDDIFFGETCIVFYHNDLNVEPNKRNECDFDNSKLFPCTAIEKKKTCF